MGLSLILSLAGIRAWPPELPQPHPLPASSPFLTTSRPPKAEILPLPLSAVLSKFYLVLDPYCCFCSVKAIMFRVKSQISISLVHEYVE